VCDWGVECVFFEDGKLHVWVLHADGAFEGHVAEGFDDFGALGVGVAALVCVDFEAEG